MAPRKGAKKSAPNRTAAKSDTAAVKQQPATKQATKATRAKAAPAAAKSEKPSTQRTSTAVKSVANPAPKNTITTEVRLRPSGEFGGGLTLEFDAGGSVETINFSPKRTVHEAFLLTCTLRGVSDVELVECKDHNEQTVGATKTLRQLLGDLEDTLCNITFSGGNGFGFTGPESDGDEGDYGFHYEYPL